MKQLLTFSKLKQLSLKKLNEGYIFLKFIVINFFDDGCTYIASALTFTSLLAIVPLMSVSFALLSSFPVFQELSGPIQNYIFEQFVPATGKVVHQYLISFTNQVSKLSIWGIIFLFITSVMVMVTIEHAMNRIWKVRLQRHGTSAFLLYWAILSLTPVMLGLSVAASSYVMSLPLITKDLHVNVSLLIKYSPFIISMLCFCFLYVVVPNCSVKIRHALIGAFIAAALMEAAKQGFTWYLSTYDTYELLYGAFATVPIFFLWVYWAWVIILLGAEVTYALSAPHHRRTGKKIDGFSHAILWLGHLWQAQNKGMGLSLEQLIKTDDHAYSIKPEEVIQVFIDQQLVSIEDNHYFLSRDLNRVNIRTLRDLLPWKLPAASKIQSITNNQLYLSLITNAEEKTVNLFNVPVSSLYE